MVARDTELLLSNMAPPIHVDDYVACGMFLPRDAMQARPMSSCGVCLCQMG